jgi:hypothetical protein
MLLEILQLPQRFAIYEGIRIEQVYIAFQAGSDSRVVRPSETGVLILGKHQHPSAVGRK